MSVTKMVKACKRCDLHKSCTSPVPIAGPTPINLLVVGEAPGKTEDEKGEPFVGSAGAHLRGVLRWAGFRVEQEVAWCNVVSCRPPSNRDPSDDEIASCKINLEAQIALANPRVLLFVGRVALKALRPDMTKITDVRGRPFWTRPGQIAIPTYHPAAVLRRKAWEKELERDCLLARQWVKEYSSMMAVWPEDCAICGQVVETYDRMGLGLCRYHVGLQERIDNIPVQERLVI